MHARWDFDASNAWTRKVGEKQKYHNRTQVYYLHKFQTESK